MKSTSPAPSSRNGSSAISCTGETISREIPSIPSPRNSGGYGSMHVKSIAPSKYSRLTRAVTSDDQPQPVSITRRGRKWRSIACSIHASSLENMSLPAW